MWIGTFHGLCNRMLRAHHSWPPQSLNPGRRDQLSAVESACAAVQRGRGALKQLACAIAGCRREGLRDVEVRLRHAGEGGRSTSSTRAVPAREGVVDFGELMLRSFELLRDNDPMRVHYQRRFAHILVDRFQDTNRLQYAWLKAARGRRGGRAPGHPGAAA